MANEYDTIWMPEYGREYWENNQINRRLSLEQLVEIAESHLEKDEKLLYEARQYLFTDTNALTTLMFSQYYHQAASPRLIELEQILLNQRWRPGNFPMRYPYSLMMRTLEPVLGHVKREILQKQIRCKRSDIVRKISFFDFI